MPQGRLSAVERRSLAFREFELQGRGWTVWPHPVQLEPAFLPRSLLGVAHTLPSDDARITPLHERAWSLLKTLVRGHRRNAAQPPETEAPVQAAVSDQELAELRLTLPPQVRVDSASMQRLISALPCRHLPLAFELAGDHESLTVSIVVEEQDQRAAIQQLKIQVPGLVVSRSARTLEERWDDCGQAGSLVIDFGLHAEFMRPLRSPGPLDPDPLLALLAVLADMDPGEMGVMQLQFQRCNKPWDRMSARALHTVDGRPFLADAPELIGQAQEKFQTPLYAVVLRLAVRAKERPRAWRIAQAAARSLEVLDRPQSNRLIPLDPGPYPLDALEQDFLLRQSRRSGMLLSASELSALLHFPAASVDIDKLERLTGTTRPLPSSCTGDGVLLGVNEHAEEQSEVRLPTALRRRHMHLIGASGTGKSTLILSMALQDLEAGRGLAVVDPHGDLVDQLLARLPENRQGDLVLVDPSDAEYTVGFNVLSANSDLERQLLSSDLVATFRRLSTSWGDQMTSVLGNAVLAFLESTRGGTLADLRRFLVEKGFRRSFLQTVRDAEVRYFWEREFPMLSGRPQAPLLTRLDALLRHRLIRQMVAQRRSTFDLRKIMDERGVLLVRLSQGAIGQENASLLGALLVSRIQQAAASRQELAERDRTDFTLYLDEFQNYLTPSMADILSGARKYRLGLVLAHQDLSQLGRGDDGIAGAAIANPATRVCFRLGDRDARALSDGFAHFTGSDLQRLGVGQAIVRVQQADADFNLATHLLPEPSRVRAEQRRAEAITRSRATYSRLRTEVQEEIDRARGPAEGIVAPPSHVPVPPEPTECRLEPEPAAPVAPSPVQIGSTEPTSGTSSGARQAPPTIVSAPGRGGQQHKYWQRLVREAAIKAGWKSTVEAKLADGLGFTDVLIQRDGVRIGVEVSISGDVEREIENLRKNLAAGLDQVLCVVADKKAQTAIEARVSSGFDKSQRARISIESPEEALARLVTLLQGSGRSTSTRVRGYLVRVP